MRFYRPRERNGRNAEPIIRGSIDGEDHEFTTDARTEKEAKAIWIDYVAKVRASTQHFRPPESFEDLAKMYLAAKGDPPKFAGYLERLYPVRLKHRDCKLGDMPADAVTSGDVMTAAQIAYRGCMNSTKNTNAIAPAAAVLHFGASEKLIPYIVVEKLKEEEPEPRRPAPDVAETLLANTAGKKHLLLLFLFTQGPRITEGLSLHWDRIRLSNRTAQIYSTKANKWVTIPLHQQFWLALANAQERTGYVFPWRSRSGVYRWLGPLCRKLKVEFSPHMARHEFGSALGERSATDRDLVDVGTWTSIKSVGRYVTPSESHTREVINRLQIREKGREGGSK